jgi:hypothetical protein
VVDIVKAGLSASAEFDSATGSPFEIYQCDLIQPAAPVKAFKAAKKARKK